MQKNPYPSNYLPQGQQQPGQYPQHFGMPIHNTNEPAYYFEQPPSNTFEPYYQGSEQSTQQYEQPRYYCKPMIQTEQKNTYHGPPPQVPPLNIIQKLSLLLKSQTAHLQSLMLGFQFNSRRREESFRRRSRSRSRQGRRRRRHSRSKSPNPEWLCPKCSFSNYDWREKCKKCSESRPTRGFMPGPEDWRCPKCSNINYARRSECNRCKAVREDK